MFTLNLSENEARALVAAGILGLKGSRPVKAKADVRRRLVDKLSGLAAGLLEAEKPETEAGQLPQ